MFNSDYWLISEAVPYFTAELTKQYKHANLLHGARMFQALVVAGWEPTRLSFKDITDEYWDACEGTAMARNLPRFTTEVFPICNREIGNEDDPDTPDESAMPILCKFTGEAEFIVPLFCDESKRKSGTRYFDVYFHHEDIEGPFLDEEGEEVDAVEIEETCEIEAANILEYLVPPLEGGDGTDDFDRILAEYLFDRLTAKVYAEARKKFYDEWGDYLIELEVAENLARQHGMRMTELNDKARNLPPPFPLEFRNECVSIRKRWMMMEDLSLEDKYKRIHHQCEQFLMKKIQGMPRAITAQRQV